MAATVNNSPIAALAGNSPSPITGEGLSTGIRWITCVLAGTGFALVSEVTVVTLGDGATGCSGRMLSVFVVAAAVVPRSTIDDVGTGDVQNDLECASHR